ncbi:hypothetical protein CR513_38584, partial [Mucuna pruriens]
MYKEKLNLFVPLTCYLELEGQKMGSSLHLNSDDGNPFLGSHIDVGEKDPLTTGTDLEAASSSKIAPSKHKYRINLSPGNVAVVMIQWLWIGHVVSHEALQHLFNLYVKNILEYPK